MTAREMNGLLKEHGFLDGEPGAYGMTEKGARYAEEQFHSRGTGGYAHYNRHWETRTWNDETAEALRADIDARPVPHPGVQANDADDLGDDLEDDSSEYYSSDDDEPSPTWTDLAVAVAIVGVILLAPLAKPLWTNHLKPAATRARQRLARRQQSEEEPVDDSDSPA